MVRRLLVLFIPFLLVAGACSNDGSPTVEGPTTTGRPTTSTTAATTTTAASPGATVTTTPPGPGMALTGPSGTSGTVSYSLAPERSEFCYRISVKGIGKPSAAHLDRTSGGVALALTAPAEDATVNTCAAADSLLIDEIQSKPSNFVVVVAGPKGTLKVTLK
jgi:hypothetical protein